MAQTSPKEKKSVNKTAKKPQNKLKKHVEDAVLKQICHKIATASRKNKIRKPWWNC